MTECNREWHPEDIKAAIRKRGVSLIELAARHGLPRYSCYAALRTPLYEGEQAIISFLNIPGHVLWPRRYAADGRSLIRRRTPKYRRTLPANHRQSRDEP